MGIVTEGVVFLPEMSCFNTPIPFCNQTGVLGFGGVFADVLFAAGNEVGVFFVCILVLAGGGGVGVRTVATLAGGVGFVVVAATVGGAGALIVFDLPVVLFFSFSLSSTNFCIR